MELCSIHPTILNYSDAHLNDAKGAITRLYTALNLAPSPQPSPVKGEGVANWSESHAQRFKVALDDDFNTPEAMAVLFDLANEVNRTKSPATAAQLKVLGGMLGLLQREAQVFLQGSAGSGLTEEQIESQIAARTAAKQAKNYAEAGRIRKELLEAGVVLEDGAAGTTWRGA